MNPYLGHPKWVVLQLLERCNLRCSMCYEWGTQGSYHEKPILAQLDPEIVLGIIDECAPGKPYFGLFGGEPFLYPHIERVMRHIKQKGCGVDSPTNGMLLKKHAEMLVDVGPNRLWISLDGPKAINDHQRGKGVFDKVNHGIQALYELRESKGAQFPKIGITYIVTPDNHTHVEEFFTQSVNLDLLDHISIEFQLYTSKQRYEAYAAVLADKFDIHDAPYARGYVQDTSVFAVVDSDVVLDQMRRVEHLCAEKDVYFIAYPRTLEASNFANFFKGKWNDMKDKRNHCSFPWIYAEVAATGDVSVCHTLYDVPIGNVNQTSFTEIWHGEPLKKVRQHLRKELWPICVACSRYYADPNKR